MYFYPLINMIKKNLSLLYMSFYEKYLKYKSKYLNLKNIIYQNAGANSDNESVTSEDSVVLSKLLVVPYMKPEFNWGWKEDYKQWNYFQSSDKIGEATKIIEELEHRMSKHRKITIKQAAVYFKAIEGLYANHMATCKGCQEAGTCKHSLVDSKCKSAAKLYVLGNRLYNECRECKENKRFLEVNAPNFEVHLKEKMGKLEQKAGSSESDNESVGSEESEATKSKLLVTPYTKENFNWGTNIESDKWNYFQTIDKESISNELIKELRHRMSKQRRITTEQAKVYIRVIEAQYYNFGRKCIVRGKECNEEAKISILGKTFGSYIKNKELIKANAVNLYGHLYEGIDYHKQYKQQEVNKQLGGSSESNSLTHLSSTPSSPKSPSPPSSPKFPKHEPLLVDSFIGKDWDFFHNGNGTSHRNELINEITTKVYKNHLILNENQIKTYLSALEAEFVKANVDCNVDCTKKSLDVTRIFSSFKQTFPKVKDIVNQPKLSPNLASYLKGERGLAQIKKQLGGGKKEIYLFKAEWCPHCVGFKPTWKKLEKELSSKYTFVTYDSEKDKDSIKKWDIKGFPTIIKKTGNDMEEYIGPRDEESVKTFITSD